MYLQISYEYLEVGPDYVYYEAGIIQMLLMVSFDCEGSGGGGSSLPPADVTNPSPGDYWYNYGTGWPWNNMYLNPWQYWWTSGISSGGVYTGPTDPLPASSWTYEGDDGSTYTDNNPNTEPDLQVDPDDHIDTRYPNLYQLIKNLKSFVKSSPEVMASLQYWSHLSKQQILDNLTFGKGPTVKVVEGIDAYSSYNRVTGENILKLNASWVRGLEAAVLPATKQGTAFLLAVSLLHELVHYGTGRNNISEGEYDFGWGFERSAFHVIVTDLNANEVSLKFKKLP
jgi:hypothetical protein